MLAKLRRSGTQAALGILGGLILVPTAGATVAVEGVLLDRSGAPTTGWVTLNPDPARNGTFPQIGATRAGQDGTFSLRVSDPSVLRKYTTNPRRSSIGDYTASAFLDDGSTGRWGFSGILRGRGKATRVLDVELRGGPPSIRLRADRPQGGAVPKGASTRSTTSPREVPFCRRDSRRIGTTSASTIIGELNNAYNDGTVASFEYGTEEKASTDFGLAVKADGGTWKTEGSRSISTSKKVGMRVKRRYSRLIRTQFRYEKIRTTHWCNIPAKTDKPETSIRPTSFLGGVDTKRQRGGLNRCQRSTASGRFPPEASFESSNNRAVTWASGATAFGVSLTTRSGFDEGVRLSYRFGGKGNKLHFICGGGSGTEPPDSSGRVFSGLRRTP